MKHHTGLNVPLDRSIEQIKGDQYDKYATDPCPGAKPAYSGEFQWRTIEASGAAYNASRCHSHQFINYDNPTSLRLKAQFAPEKKLGGIMLWSLEMGDASNSLLNAVQDVRTLFFVIFNQNTRTSISSVATIPNMQHLSMDTQHNLRYVASLNVLPNILL